MGVGEVQSNDEESTSPPWPGEVNGNDEDFTPPPLSGEVQGNDDEDGATGSAGGGEYGAETARMRVFSDICHRPYLAGKTTCQSF